MRRLILILTCVLNFSVVLYGQQKHKIYGGDKCIFDYLSFSPSGKKSDAKPKIIQICDFEQELYECFEVDSLKKLSEYKNYDFYYVSNTHNTLSKRLECLDVIRNKATFSTNIASKKFLEQNVFLFVNDTQITQDHIIASNLMDIYTNIILISNITKTDSPQNESDKIDYTLLNPFFKSTTGEEKSDSKYFGPAQNFDFTLSGVLKDSKTGESLPFSSILVKGTSNGTTTNVDGFFTLHNVPSDTSTIIASYIGYEKSKIKLNPNLSKSNLLIEITPSSFNLNEVVITNQREDILNISTEYLSTIKMSPKKLKQLPNLGEQDIMRSFQLMPGISASNESSSGMYVRGGTPDQNLIVYDGFTIYHVDHLYGFYSAFNSNAIKDVQLYKGGFESRFGGRLSSVTEITGKDGNQNNISFGGSLSLLNLNAYAEIPINSKFTSILAYRRSYKGPIYNTIFDQFNNENVTSNSAFQDRFTTTASSYFYDLNGKFTYKPSDKDILSLSLFQGSDNLDNGYELNTPQRLVNLGIDFNLKISDLTNYGNFATGIKWSRKWSAKLYGNSVISYSNYYSDREFNRYGSVTNEDQSKDISGGFYEDNNLKDYSIKSDYQLDLSQSVQLKFGAFGTSYDIKYDYTQNDTVSIINKKDNGSIFGSYLQTNFKLFDDKLRILPGIRFTNYDITKNIYWEPRFNAHYRVLNKLKLTVGWGEYYQFANRVTRIDLSSGSKDFWVLSNGNDIPVGLSEHYITGLSYETSKYLISIEGYYKYLSGISEYTQYIESSPSGITNEESFYSGNGYTRGIEFLMQKKVGKFNGWMSYVLSEAKNKFDIYGSDYFSADQDVTHEFKWVGIYNYNRWDFSATWIYATGKPYTAPAGGYSLTLLDGSSKDYFTTTDKNSLRFADYHRLDIAVNYKLYKDFTDYNKLGHNKKSEIGEIGLSFFNFYNRTNNWYNQYELIEGEIIETNINYLGFIPNITLTLRF